MVCAPTTRERPRCDASWGARSWHRHGGSRWIPGSWRRRWRTTWLLTCSPPWSSYCSRAFKMRGASRTMREHKTPEFHKRAWRCWGLGRVGESLDGQIGIPWFLSVQQGLGGGRCVVPSRHGHKGGGRRGGWDGRSRGALLLQRDDHGRGVGLCDPEALGQGREGAGGGIAEGAPRREQRWQQGMDPRMGFALDHAE